MMNRRHNKKGRRKTRLKDGERMEVQTEGQQQQEEDRQEVGHVAALPLTPHSVREREANRNMAMRWHPPATYNPIFQTLTRAYCDF